MIKGFFNYSIIPLVLITLSLMYIEANKNIINFFSILITLNLVVNLYIRIKKRKNNG